MLKVIHWWQHDIVNLHSRGDVPGANPSVSRKRGLWSAELVRSSLLPLYSIQKRKIQTLSAALFSPSWATCLGLDAGSQRALGWATHNLNSSLVCRACWKDLPRPVIHWGYSPIPRCTIQFFMWVSWTRESMASSHRSGRLSVPYVLYIIPPE